MIIYRKDVFRNISYHVYIITPCRHITVEYYFPFLLSTKDSWEFQHVTSGLLDHLALINTRVTRLIRTGKHTTVRLVYQDDYQEEDAKHSKYLCHKMFEEFSNMLIENMDTCNPSLRNQHPGFLDYFLDTFEVMHNRHYTSMFEHFSIKSVTNHIAHPCLHREKTEDIIAIGSFDGIRHEPLPRPDLYYSSNTSRHWGIMLFPELLEVYSWLDQRSATACSDNGIEEPNQFDRLQTLPSTSSELMQTTKEMFLDFLKCLIVMLCILTTQ